LPSRGSEREIEPSSRGRSNSVYSTVMSNARRIIVISIPKRDPTPMGSGVSNSTRDMRGLKLGSWRSSAT